MNDFNFPKDFIFGAATAAHQIEGAVSEDGKGPSIWDTFSSKPGKIKTGEAASVSCNHYNLYREDVRLMAGLGLDAYRGSISWPRVLPEGRGRVNDKGLDFYSRLTDELLSAGITPYYTLFHWDLPERLQRAHKGFQSRETVGRFCDYTEAVVGKLGDRVKNWITVNEPWEYSGLGHLLGEHAPGKKSPWAFFSVMHNLLLAHGEAVPIIRSSCPGAEVGITVSITPVHPETEKPKDVLAAGLGNEFLNHITLGPLLNGKYPERLFKRSRLFLPDIKDPDLDIISRPIDFIGINNYQREWAVYKRFIPFFNFWITGTEGKDRKNIIEDAEYTEMGWEVYPDSISESIDMVRAYGDIPIIITENGAAFEDRVSSDGLVHDERRTSYLKNYLRKVSDSLSSGADIRGYFVWSLMDNFEWAEGFRPRFGIVHVDYDTGKRTVKDSGRWYSELISETKSR